jgi:leucyl aminopeptidase
MEPRVTTLTLSDQQPAELAVDAVVVGIHSGAGGVELGLGAAGVDSALGGRLAEVLTQLGATGSAGEVTKLATLGATAAPVVAAVGLGKVDKAGDAETIRRAAGAAVRALAGTARVGVALSDDPALLRATAEGALLGAYDYVAYKSSTADGYKPPVKAVTAVVPDAKDKAARAAVDADDHGVDGELGRLLIGEGQGGHSWLHDRR